ncbi:MAG: hypothetical protein LBE08_11965 [Bifidobacteriaceae bacterium]|jgi:formate C-acetyltransferase|nr:hypothetical protein [Bifidobacteriaceae bacterium]
MNKRIEELKNTLVAGKHKALRDAGPSASDASWAQELAASGTAPVERAALRTVRVLERQQPVILPGQNIVLLRTAPLVPEIFTPEELAKRRSSSRVHELGRVSNVAADYGRLLKTGFASILTAADALEALPGSDPGFGQAVRVSVEAVLDLADRYGALGAKLSHPCAALPRIARHGAETFAEALQLLRLAHFAVWCSGTYHNTLGRFDQYLWPYLETDLQNGRLDRAQGLELVEEFFLACNWDADLYPGVQQGDNGQSLVVGGVDAAGDDAWNVLSELVLEASLELALIDPKINMRVDSATPEHRYMIGTRLTARGLGFPQYSNDDVVIDGLVQFGYELEDARNYVVAACWEFIVPGVGMDVPNIAALSFPGVVERTVLESLAAVSSFDAFLDAVADGVVDEARRLADATRGLLMEPAPLLSALMTGPLESGHDMSQGLRYNNYGIHGTGLATAADSLAAIGQVVFGEGLPAQALLEALRDNFNGHDELRTTLREVPPKMGNACSQVDSLAARLLEAFADALEPLRNDRGGAFRAGTGSAMYYVSHAAEVGATADGRKAGEFFSANLAPALGVRVAGPLSVIKSFAGLPTKRAINGGPLTIELHSGVFRNESSTDKVAQLVRLFIQLGGHQLQLNALDRQTLLDAQRHPEQHRNLIVRVWGWSAYFVELDRVFQDQIIQRAEMVP